MNMKKLLEAVTKFAGEPEQKPGDQVQGTDVAKKGGKEHPFKGRLVGDSKDNMLKGLTQVSEEKGLEWDLAEAFANFNEDDLGVEPKRPGRKSDRPAREYTKHGKPSKRYTTVEEGWNTGSDRVSLPDDPHTYWSGTGALQKEYDALYEKLVPAQGAADTIQGEVLRAASKIVYRHYNDGDEFNRASYRQLEQYIGPVTSYDDLAHKATEFALKADGNYTPNQGWDSLDVMDYGPAEEEEYDDDDDDYGDDGWPDDDEELEESTGTEIFTDFNTWKKAATALMRGKASINRDYTHPPSNNNPQIIAVDLQDGSIKGIWDDGKDTGTVGQTYVFVKGSTAARADGQFKHSYYKTKAPKAPTEPKTYANEEVDEGAADVYSITSERNGRERSKSGTLAELIEYYGYTLETGKSYEHERGNRKINLNPKSIESLVQNLNNAKSNAAANGQSNERFYVDHGNMAEGRGDSKGLHKKVTIVKGRDAGKTGYVRQIKTDKIRNRVYLDLDLEDGGQAVVLKQDVRLVKDLAEGYTGRETKDGVWRVFKDGQAVAAAGPFKSAEEANAWIKKQNQGVAEARTTWNNDFYVYDPKTKAVKKKFRTHKGAKQYAEANGLAVASAEYYHDSVSKEVEEGWESGPEERTRVERDPDAEYDARRQEKLDAPYAQKEPEAKGYHVVSLDTRQPVTDKVFPTKGHAMAYIQSNHSKNLAYRAINEGVESTDPVEGAVLAAVQELIQQGHTEVAPEVITNMVVAATSRPFLLKDLVDANKNSPAIQHYVDSINPSKVKFSSDILTVKNENPAKDKQQAQAGVSAMASRAAGRNRLGESGDTPLRDKEDYQAKRSALQQIQMDPSTSQDPQLKHEVALRLSRLNNQYELLSTKLREFKESRGHKVIATKLGNMDRMSNIQIPTPAERQEQLRIRNAKEPVKKQVKEYGATSTGSATSSMAAGTASVDPQQAQKIAQATSTLKAATGSTAPNTSIAKAIDAASQGTGVNSTDMKVLEPLMKDVATVAQDPKLANQFKTLANQVNQTQKLQQQIVK